MKIKLEHIEAIEAWQKDPCVHSLTCGKNSLHKLPQIAITHEPESPGDTNVSLICPNCDWTQDWIPDIVVTSYKPKEVMSKSVVSRLSAQIKGDTRSEVLLYSGGIDSYVAWHYLGKPKALYVDLGLVSNKAEMVNVRSVVRRNKELGFKIMYHRFDLSGIPGTESELPMRNMFLAMVASCYADKIWLISQKGETNLADRSPEFMRKASQLLTILWNGKPKIVWSPFFNMTKVEMVEWYVKNVGSIDELDKNTLCCYRGEIFCGECGADFRKWIALRLNGGGKHYDKKIISSGLLEKYLERAKANDPSLGKERVEEILAINELLRNEG